MRSPTPSLLPSLVKVITTLLGKPVQSFDPLGLGSELSWAGAYGTVFNDLSAFHLEVQTRATTCGRCGLRSQMKDG